MKKKKHRQKTRNIFFRALMFILGFLLIASPSIILNYLNITLTGWSALLLLILIVIGVLMIVKALFPKTL